jgi:hypothetical protein
MNAKDAITAHVNWKLRINTLLVGKLNEKLDPSSIERDNVCELGKWLHLDASKTMQKQPYTELLTAHAAFHCEAARIVREVYAGHKIGQEVIAPSSAFASLSEQVVRMLMKVDQGKTG